MQACFPAQQKNLSLDVIECNMWYYPVPSFLEVFLLFILYLSAYPLLKVYESGFDLDLLYH